MITSKSKWVIFVGFALFYSCNKPIKTGYININKVYSEIEFSEPYKAKLANIDRAIVEIIQIKKKELINEKEIIKNNISSNQEDLQRVFSLQTEFDSIQRVLMLAREDSSSFYNSIITDSVNKLVYQYGKLNGYDYVFSPANTNVFMFADSTHDVTKEVIKFINKH